MSGAVDGGRGDGGLRLSCRDLRARFGRTRALDGASLEVPARSAMGIIGRNGAGKSTLLRAIAGVRAADSGSIIVRDESTGRALRGAALRRGIGFVPDDLSAWDWMRIGDLLAMLRRMHPSFDEALVRGSLRSLGLDPDASIRGLSRGTRARVAFLAGICHRPRLLLLDEPMLGVDAPSHDAIISLLAAWRAERPCTLIVSSHQIGDLARLVDSVAILDAGQIIEVAEIDAIMEESRRVVVRPAPDSPLPLPEEAFVLDRRDDALVLGVRRGAEALASFLRARLPGSSVTTLPLSLHDACVDRLRRLEAAP